MTEIPGYRGTAFNPATASENRIHADDVARLYGFRGGLVPGVTVYAYAVEPAVRGWGLDWLSRGAGSIVLNKPLYDGSAFEVAVEPADEGFATSVTDGDGVRCADGSFSLPETIAKAPVRRGDRPVPAAADRPEATRDVLERLRREDMGAYTVTWDGTGEAARYRRDLADMPALVRPDRDGFAHPAFTLGLANWVLSANVRLGPWIHVESRIRHLAPIPLGTVVTVEAVVTDLVERRGHEFVDLDVAAYAGDAPLFSAFHRAIYRLRPAAAKEAS